MKQHCEWNLEKIIGIINKLRSPDGCMWDMQQNREDVAKYLIEEAYEVLDAIDTDTPDDLKEELGDLLFQILFLAKISEETGEFDIYDVIKGISEKMIRRHPHVFGNKKVRNVEEIKSNWEDIKRYKEGKIPKEGFLLQNIPRSMPSLLTAKKITERASKTGFDWKNTEGVIKKIEEETKELKAAIHSKNEKQIKDETGDIFFTLVNLCRFINVDPEDALRATTNKFVKRFSYIEKKLKYEGKDLSEATLTEMDHLWDQSKKNET